MARKNWKGVKLYHYTSFPVLQGILDRGELWLCNVKVMNDRQEMFHYMSLVENSVCEGLEPDKCGEVHRLFANQLDRLENQPVYAASFSRLEDDAAQWERYASHGQGISIKFNAHLLKKIAEGRARLQPVYYTRDAKASKHTALIRDYIMTGEVDRAAWGSIDGVFENCWAASSAYKHISFKSEKEVRLVSLPFSPRYFLGEPQYEMEEWGLREYYILNLKRNQEIPVERLIKEVMIGPRANVTADTVERYIRSLNPEYEKIKVTQSDCPLR